MQQRRRKEKRRYTGPSGDTVLIPPDFWTDLKGKDIDAVCRLSGARRDSDGAVVIHFLHEELRMDIESKRLWRRKNKKWSKSIDPLLMLVFLVYLLNVSMDEIRAEMIGVKDLKEAHFFQGPHTLKTDPLIAAFGDHPEAFKEAGRRLGGNFLDMADAAFCLKPFPKIPVYFLLWCGDEEFPANLSVLFDRSIESHLPADAIWALVSLLTDRLLQASIS